LKERFTAPHASGIIGCTLTKVNDSHLGVMIEAKNDGKYEKYSKKTYVRSSEKMAVLQ
jgi:hypothetical protein